ncbi:MAG: Mur ligase family protein, partial [Patescibacteria group bacterium]
MEKIKEFKRIIPKDIKNLLHFIQAFAAVVWFRFPARNLKVIGVTGTDGKTTTSTLIYHILKTAGLKVALVSTVGAYIGNNEIDTGFHVTTPDSWMLQKLLKRIVKQGYRYVVLEVTSHGLDQHRLFGSNIQIAVLTNITHEHLDYHKTYQNYLKTKTKIFQNAKIAIINKDDKSFRLVTKHIKPQTKTIPYTLSSVGKVISNSIEYKFPEKYNRYNATAASLVATEVGADNSVIAKAIKTFPGVPG